MWRRFNATLAQGRVPHREVIDGVLVIFGGAFLITPGFLSDIVGVSLAPAADARGRATDRGAPPRPPGTVAAPGAPRRTTTSRAPRASTTTQPSAARAVSAPALALSFFDPAHDIHGTARSGATMLFEGRRPTALPEGPAIEAERRAAGAPSWPDKLSLELEPVAAEADLDGVRARVAGCAARSTAGAWTASARVSETARAAALGGARRGAQHLGAGRRAARACSRSPAARAAPSGHGEEEVTARLFEDDAVLAGRGRPHLDRLRRRRPPAQRRASSCGCPARSTRGAARGR